MLTFKRILNESLTLDNKLVHWLMDYQAEQLMEDVPPTVPTWLFEASKKHIASQSDKLFRGLHVTTALLHKLQTSGMHTTKPTSWSLSYTVAQDFAELVDLDGEDDPDDNAILCTVPIQKLSRIISFQLVESLARSEQIQSNSNWKSVAQFSKENLEAEVLVFDQIALTFDNGLSILAPT